MLNPDPPNHDLLLHELDHLIVDAGAELAVTNPTGKLVYLRPLARIYRVDTDGVIWVRPIDGRWEHPDHGPVFSLTAMPPRSLRYTAYQLGDHELELQLWNEQVARIRPASSDASIALIADFDRFSGTVVDSGTADTIRALAEDSWWGEWA